MIESYWNVTNSIFTNLLSCHGKRLQRAPWDKFAGAEFTEVLDIVMPCGRVMQAASCHFLGQRFAKVFEIQFLDQSNKFMYPEMTCCGFSTRVLASPLAVHGDEKGLVLPPGIAQY